MEVFKDLTGRRFGKLTVIKREAIMYRLKDMLRLIGYVNATVAI